MHPPLPAKDPRAAFFDERADGWEERCYPPDRRERLKALISCFAVRRGGSVLDLGAGTGVLAPYLRAAIGPGGLLVALDVSFAMLRRAAAKKAYAPGLCVRATAMRIPLRDACMDSVVCFASFPHFSDKASALAEIRRVLKPGGGLAVAHLFSREELARHHGERSPVANDRLPDDETMLGLFRDAGFTPPAIVNAPGRYLAVAAARET